MKSIIIILTCLQLMGCAAYRDHRYEKASKKWDKDFEKFQLYAIGSNNKKKVLKIARRLLIRGHIIDHMPHSGLTDSLKNHPIQIEDNK